MQSIADSNKLYNRLLRNIPVASVSTPSRRHSFDKTEFKWTIHCAPLCLARLHPSRKVGNMCYPAMQSIGGSNRLNLTAIASFEIIPVAIASARCGPMSPVLLLLLNGLRRDHSVELIGYSWQYVLPCDAIHWRQQPTELDGNCLLRDYTGASLAFERSTS
jgi:hypothetical protein